ncbi:predicted protein [Nematostella vectensis]|uniref:EGF-like domain-containing protein n=1 Tax=Nematostella vectensis TaxID=45351 RepID=A7T1Z2_NEMVE|nr:predicted protein [Nematostella vectensis]|eukprot:XP_001622124.1 predicted protein [Nematostella vectensis]
MHWHVSGSKCATSVPGTSLIGYVFMVLRDTDIHQGFQRCKKEVQCQSLNYYIRDNTCHLSNRTIQQKPANALLDPGSFYFENPYKSSLGSILSLPAVSCLEIKSSSDAVTSGLYWLIDAQSGSVVEDYCDMVTGLTSGTCKGNPCKNGGTCHFKSPGVFSCTCAAGFSGNQCETDIDDCLGISCLNGGQCIDRGHTYTCNCTSPFYGSDARKGWFLENSAGAPVL